MRYEEFVCHPALAPYVRLIWLLEVDRPGAFGPPERILPDGIVEVVFTFGRPFPLGFAGEPTRLQAESFAISQTRRYVEIQPRRGSGFVSVRFHPWGAYHFFSAPVAAFADQAVATTALWGHEASELADRLSDACGDTERIDLVQGFLMRQLRRHGKADIQPLVRAVTQRAGRLTVARLCLDLGVTERSLERTFAAALGASPRHFARLTRFLRACNRLRRGRWSTLSEVAQDCGYYDQPHFNGEFKAFAGLTPRGFLAHGHLAYLDVE